MEAWTVTTRRVGEVIEVWLGEDERIGALLRQGGGFINAEGGDFEYQTIDEAIEDLLIDYAAFEGEAE